MKIRILIPVLLWGLTGGVFASDSAPGFSLKRWKTGEAVKLSDFAGKIVVLDFFAWWCGPCAQSAPVVEEQIQKFYEAKKGNPNGVPVRVISVNVEEDKPKNTAAFIKKHGPSLVLNDVDGAVLKSYGGEGLPHFVIIDGTAATTNQPSFKIVSRSTGFEGVDAMRRVIDAVKPEP